MIFLLHPHPTLLNIITWTKMSCSLVTKNHNFEPFEQVSCPKPCSRVWPPKNKFWSQNIMMRSKYGCSSLVLCILVQATLTSGHQYKQPWNPQRQLKLSHKAQYQTTVQITNTAYRERHLVWRLSAPRNQRLPLFIIKSSSIGHLSVYASLLLVPLD